MVVRTSKMGGENQRKVARRTGGREVADFGFASTAKVATSSKIAVTGAKRWGLLNDPRGKAHHEKSCGVEFLCFRIGSPYDRRCGDSHEELPKVNLVQRHTVAAIIACVRP